MSIHWASFRRFSSAISFLLSIFSWLTIKKKKENNNNNWHWYLQTIFSHFLLLTFYSSKLGPNNQNGIKFNRNFLLSSINTCALHMRMLTILFPLSFFLLKLVPVFPGTCSCYPSYICIFTLQVLRIHVYFMIVKCRKMCACQKKYKRMMKYVNIFICCVLSLHCIERCPFEPIGKEK